MIGLLGGSFNPAHRAHRRISLHARAALRLDEVWWLVSPGNVLKPVEGMAQLDRRFASARAMARAAPIRVSAIEAQWGTRCTVDALRRRRPLRRAGRTLALLGLASFEVLPQRSRQPFPAPSLFGLAMFARVHLFPSRKRAER